MRTTITLDGDAATAIKRIRKSRGVGLKEIVNGALREGLKQLIAPPGRRARYTTRVVDLGRLLAVEEGKPFR